MSGGLNKLIIIAVIALVVIESIFVPLPPLKNGAGDILQSGLSVRE